MEININDYVKEIDTRLDRILYENKITINQVEYYISILNFYFQNDRPQEFSLINDKMMDLYHLVINSLSINDGIQVSNIAFLFSYTLSKENYLTIQKNIRTKIAEPYYKWIRKNIISEKIKRIEFEKFDNRILIITRHAVTKGMYSPGSLAYTYAKTFLQNGVKVDIVSLGDVDDSFKNFVNSNNNILLYEIEKEPNCIETYEKFKAFLRTFKPKLVITEIEFDVTSLMSIAGCSCPIILMSAGFYNLPWYDVIGIPSTSDILKSFDRKKESFIYPIYFDSDLMNPRIDETQIQNAKTNLGFNDNDIIVCFFSRMEKFSQSYCDVCIEILKLNKNIRFLFAGSNDPSLLKRNFSNHIKSNRVTILPSSDVHVLGNLATIGLETFPLTAGASSIELMAKGIPVITMSNSNQNENLSYRIEDLVCENKKEVLERITLLINDRLFYKKCSNKSKELIYNQQKPVELYNAINNSLLQSSTSNWN